uniref:Uncharacterized protein n=1 Tax=viral metagenome TaxID=1070528 RepID=A0A6C0BLH7_9ZZZZ
MRGFSHDRSMCKIDVVYYWDVDVMIKVISG